ncbi:MAG: DUF418 domain-containing protein [Sphingomonas sp.]|uniref:DUF418 domain-containing protein n=1 Tax=Sphingomonas sp. TaxID=28214 RepID=UPI0017D13096|nr:DUF418 domain-containing protein [Sphingomonas sp.]MBA3666915.1 DUF418 domain-containing protein [Sphingomonas sp.]
MTAAGGQRLATLDIIRGVAVVGILAMNIVAFAMPDAAYLNPRAYGTNGPADLISWLVSYVLFDGKMRGLFSFLFGASMLLVIDRARAGGESAARIHFSRMLWLLLFGYLHFYFIWYGDILTGYASLGMIAWFFRDQPAPTLIKWGAILTAVQFALFAFFAMAFAQASAAAGTSVEAARQWAQMSEGIGVPTPDQLTHCLALYRSNWWSISFDKLTHRTTEPLLTLSRFGWEVIANLLFGMALLKNGFFTGEWADADYRRIMRIGFAITIPVFLVLAAIQWGSDFAVPAIMLSMAVSALFRPLMVVAIAALVILTTRPGGWLVDRIAATGRAAFTNYLGTSIAMTSLFYGYGLGWFGALGRAQLWLIVAPMWLLMLGWSEPWLKRFYYGPFEWLWRSLARWQPQPMRR